MIVSRHEPAPPLPDLSRFEKRLVHQLVRAEFREYVTFPRSGAIAIKRYDEAREKTFKEAKKRRVDEAIYRYATFWPLP